MTKFTMTCKTPPDGEYTGKQSGYIVTIDGKSEISFQTENGLRGMNIPVKITITSGIAKVEVIR